MISLGETDILTLINDCRNNQVPCISDATRQLLSRYIQQYQPKNYLEIGSAWGVSLHTAHSLMSQWGGRAVALERSLPNVQIVQQRIQEYGLTDIAIHHINANHPGREADIITQPIDFAFIDARKSKYHIYLQTILPYMAAKSMIVCDDVIEFAHKLLPLYEFLEDNQLDYETVTLSDGDGVVLIRLKDTLQVE